jgi:hypothetical protein
MQWIKGWTSMSIVKLSKYPHWSCCTRKWGHSLLTSFLPDVLYHLLLVDCHIALSLIGLGWLYKHSSSFLRCQNLIFLQDLWAHFPLHHMQHCHYFACTFLLCKIWSFATTTTHTSLLLISMHSPQLLCWGGSSVFYLWTGEVVQSAQPKHDWLQDTEHTSAGEVMNSSWIRNV